MNTFRWPALLPSGEWPQQSLCSVALLPSSSSFQTFSLHGLFRFPTNLFSLITPLWSIANMNRFSTDFRTRHRCLSCSPGVTRHGSEHGSHCSSTVCSGFHTLTRPPCSNISFPNTGSRASVPQCPSHQPNRGVWFYQTCFQLVLISWVTGKILHFLVVSVSSWVKVAAFPCVSACP